MGPTFKFKKTEVSSEMVRRNLPEMLLNNEKILGNAKSMSINGKQPKSSRQQSYNDDLFSYDDELSRLNVLQFRNEGDGVCDPADFGSSRRPNELDSLSTEAKALPQQEEVLEECDRAYFPSPGLKNGKYTDEKQTYRCDLQQGTVKSMRLEDQPISDNRLSAFDTEVGKMPLSSTISDDEEFNMHMKKATGLLKHARECLTSRVDEEKAEIVLYKSASLLSKAIAMKPMSLRAVGQLGNTFLLHGELKLRISRELRTLLSRSDSSDERGPRVQPPGSKKVVSKDKVALLLVDACEECEQLLVEAGRRYRMALSIDGNDIRALYNWGLALSFRAQLIADIGPEAAVDADQVYLAAIDKFDALMSRSNAYAPDGLFRWGIALQQRSHLRPSSSKEERKLLHQAKRLFEDALRMDSDNVEVREALSSCISELNYRHL
ncbi:protein HLB1-like [Magnolia sinica]|uniref:protein HLB1-like n=1 Tax=Magnolia sinica TaxID=86752 RepID=UPI002657C7BD|nr:protein HLB1-like [Magnolia sinica]